MAKVTVAKTAAMAIKMADKEKRSFMVWKKNFVAGGIRSVAFGPFYELLTNLVSLSCRLYFLKSSNSSLMGRISACHALAKA